MVLLVLAVSVLMIPTLGVHLDLAVRHHEVALSDIAAVVLLIVFVLSAPGSVRRQVRPSPEDVVAAHRARNRRDQADPRAPVNTTTKSAPQVAAWSISLVVVALLASSVAAAFVSDWFVSALTPALSALHMSEVFAGLVVVAIAGNAVENVVGVQLAARNRSDYALSVILQSPVQIALVLIPALVLLSGVIGGAQLTLGVVPFARHRPSRHDSDRSVRRAGRRVDLARGGLPGGPLRSHRGVVLVGVTIIRRRSEFDLLEQGAGPVSAVERAVSRSRRG